MKQVICNGLNGVRTTRIICVSALGTPEQGECPTSEQGGWELAHGDQRAIQGHGLQLTVKRWAEGKWGGIHSKKCLRRKTG